MKISSVKSKVALSAFSFIVVAVLTGLLLFSFLSSAAAPGDEIQDLCFQTVSGDSVESESTSLRFLFTVGSLDYTRVGFVFSDSNEDPTVGGDDCHVYETNTVYSAVRADGKTVGAPGGRYWVVVKMIDIPQASFGKQIYVNAFVEDGEGIRYADARSTTVRYAFAVNDGDYIPVLRFALTSDVHTRVMNDVGATEKATTEEVAHSALMADRLFASSYNYADGEAYDRLDAVVLVGDYTDEGTVNQYNAFFDVVNENLRSGTALLACLGNHEYRNPGESEVSNNSSFSTSYDRFEDYFGYDVDNVHVINGYTFIGFASDCKGGRGYTASKAEWLEEQILAAIASDPTGKKPIFVFGHVPVWETCLGSIREGNYPTDDIGAVLEKYPQVVYMSGHTHAPACDPESVWQGKISINASGFTAINTGTLAYDDSPFYTGDGTTRGSYFRRDLHGGYQYVMLGKYFEHAEWYASVYTIVEVDANNVVRLRYYDAEADRFLFEPVYIDSIGEPENFSFTDARKANSEAPTFSEPLTLLSASYESVRVSIPNATCPDYVRSYRADILQGGNIVKTVYRQGGQQKYPLPEITASFSDLDPDTDYTVRVYAYNAYGVMSDPLTLAVHTPTDNGGNPAPDVFSFGFDQNGVARNLLTGETLTQKNEPTVTSDGNGGYYAGFDGNDAYCWDGIADFYDVMETGFTFEWIGSVSDTVRGNGVLSGSYDGSRYVNLASNQETGGIGLEYNADGKAYLYLYIMNGSNGNYYGAGATIPVGETVHLVGTYDGSVIRFYVNGELAATENRTGKVWFPLKESSQFLAVGGDSALYGVVDRNMNGEIRAMNIYSSVLSADAVYAKYQASGVGD